MRNNTEKTCKKVKKSAARRDARGLRGGKEGCITLQKSACGGKTCEEFCKGVYAELWHPSSTPRRGAADSIASRIPPGRVENPTNLDSNRPTDQQSNKPTNQQSNNPTQQSTNPTTQQPQQPNNQQTTKPPNNPTTQKQSNPTTQESKNPTTQQPNNPKK